MKSVLSAKKTPPAAFGGGQSPSGGASPALDAAAALIGAINGFPPKRGDPSVRVDIDITDAKPKQHRWHDFSAPGAVKLYDQFWKKAPVFHISRKQFFDWGDTFVKLSEEVARADQGRAPFDIFCIEIDPHAGTDDFRASKDSAGQAISSRVEGLIVFCNIFATLHSRTRKDPEIVRDVALGLPLPAAKLIAGIGPVEAAEDWVILERTTVYAQGINIPPQITTTTFQYDAVSGRGGYMLNLDGPKVPEEAKKPDLKKLDHYAMRTMRRVMTLVTLLNEHETEAYDPLAGLKRSERRPQQTEAKRRGWSGKHYRIFLDRKRHKPQDPETIGTGTPHAYKEYVRRHKRTMKNGRVVWIDPFVKGKDKPDRPGGRSEYDAWGLDK